MAELLSFTALIVAIIAFNKVSRLEKEWQAKREDVFSTKQPAFVPQTETEVSAGPFPIVPLPPVPEPPVFTPQKPGLGTQAWQWFLHDWPVKLGAILFFLAIGWTLPYYAPGKLFRQPVG